MQLNACLINLPKRKERLLHAERELTKFFGSLGNVTLIEGVSLIENTTLAVREAHKKCVLHAKQNEFENVLIIEDDIKFRDNAKTYFDELIQNAPKDFECLLFGIYSGKIEHLENQYFDKVNKFSGLHFYILNSSAYERVLNYNGTKPIDHWIGENLNCYISKKHFAYQIDGWSDNAKCNTNYNTECLNVFKKYFF